MSEQLEAMRALVLAPFIITLLVGAVIGIAALFFIER